MRKSQILTAFAAVLIATPAMAQGRRRDNAPVPPGQRPAAGMCRVWIDGVPPGQQPAQTDCGTAAARVPLNGRVIYGDRTTNGRVNNSRFDDRRPNRNQRVLDANGRVVTNDGRRCTQRQDQNGSLRTVCSDARGDGDDQFDRDDDSKKGKSKRKKGKKHDGDGDN
jgi:hypothetical protein